MKETLKSILKKTPGIGKLYSEYFNYKRNSFFPPGHYYSPVISIDDIKNREQDIWKSNLPDAIQGINLNVSNQIRIVNELSAYYNQMPFEDEKKENRRYYFNNVFYSYSDGIILYAMMRHFKPKRIIEAGSGYTSALMLDVNDRFFDKRIELTFIEPFPERLYSLINTNDRDSQTILVNTIQQTDPEIFKQLEKGDILFIDSSHVVKTGSDVNYILFEILPILKSGVLIHFHDIFYPFEYPKDWVLSGKNWNELYFLRAFLMYNSAFEIKLFTDFMHKFHKETFTGMPLCYKNTGGNLWIEKK